MDIERDSEPISSRLFESDWRTMSPEISRLTGSPSFFLMKVIHEWQKKFREELVGFDLTNTQFTMLTSLLIMTREGNLVTQTDLAIFLSADKMMVSEVMRTLEKKGYVSRKNHPGDKRAKSIVVTEKGLDTIDRAVKEAVKFDEQFFSVIGSEREEFIRILRKLL